MKHTAVEWFAGGGGAALGIEEAGFSHLSLVEWDHDACETLRAADLGNVVEKDIRDVSIEEMIDRSRIEKIDLLHASPPCQAFSQSGERKGAEDDRNGFPWTIDKIDELFLAGLAPRFVTIENVPGLTLHKKKSGCERGLKPKPGTCPRCYWDHWIVPAFRARFDWVDTNELCASDYGVPQKRYRIFLIAGDKPVPWPKPTHSFEALVWSKWIDGSYWPTVGLDGPAGQPNRDEKKILERLLKSGEKPSLLPWVTVRQALFSNELRTSSFELRAPGEDNDRSQSMRNLSPDEPSPVVDCGRTDGSYRAPSVLIETGKNTTKEGERVPQQNSIDEPALTVTAEKSAAPVLVMIETGQNTTKEGGCFPQRNSIDEPALAVTASKGAAPTLVLEGSNKGRAQGGVKRGPLLSSVDNPSLSVDTVPGHVRVLGGGANPRFAGDARSETDITDLPSTTIAAENAYGNNAIEVEEIKEVEEVAESNESEDNGSGWKERLSKWDEPSRTVSTVQNNTVPVAGATIDEPSVTVCSTEYKGARHQEYDESRTPMRASDQLLRGTGRRRLEPEECAVLQDFPKDHPFRGNKTSRYEQIGNAVPRRLAKAIAEEIRKVLEGEASSEGSDRS